MMFKHKTKRSITLNPNDPLPKDPGINDNDNLRPPPKTFFPYQEYGGYAPESISKMLQDKKRYEEECEKTDVVNEIALFEAKHNNQSGRQKFYVKKDKPIPPKLDTGLVNSFEPPYSQKFFDFNYPHSTQKSSSRLSQKHSEKCMVHGCPACNPNHYNEIKPEPRPTSQNTKFRSNKPSGSPNTTIYDTRMFDGDPNLPLRINKNIWNIHDEPDNFANANEDVSNKRIFRNNPNPFYVGMIKSQDGTIPIYTKEMKESARRSETQLQLRTSRQIMKEQMDEEKKLHRRFVSSQNMNQKFNDYNVKLGLKSQQDWAVKATKKKEVSPIRHPRKKEKTSKEKEEDQEAIEAMKELAAYDDKIYKEYKKKKNDRNYEINVYYEANLSDSSY